MSVLDSRIKVNFVVSEFLLQILYENVAFFCVETSCRMVLDFSVFHANQIASQREVVICELHANACRFERSASLVNFPLVVS